MSERERCARAIEALAVAIRDHGPTSAEGLLTALAGAQVGTLLDAAALLRAGSWPGPHRGSLFRTFERVRRTPLKEEDGYPGSLLPPKRGAP